MPHISHPQKEKSEMNLYHFFWVMLIVTSLWVSLGGFMWAHRHGQFKDQDRARFLPLRGEMVSRHEDQEKGAVWELYVTVGILGIGLVAVFFAAAMAALRYVEGGS
jgi:hypothetical protein